MAHAVLQAAYTVSCFIALYSRYIALIRGMRRRLLHAVNTRFGRWTWPRRRTRALSSTSDAV